MTRPRLALLPDFPEEHWPSMALVAEQQLSNLTGHQADRFDTRIACPRFRPRLSRVLGERAGAKNVDRLFNRFVTYPHYAKTIVNDFDVFHVCDHSYSQLVHALPADRTGVFCHDLDTFRCLLEPAAEPRPRWFRAMAKRILRGMQKARLVFHSTATVRSQILRHGLIDSARLVHAPYGIASEFFERPELVQLPAELSWWQLESPVLLHVGSCIPRKRIDVLLEVFSRVRQEHSDVRLVQVGGEFTDSQRQQISQLHLESAVTQVRGLTRQVLAMLYRSARMVLMTSEAEGFGLPVAEALASGAMVVASDIPVLREVADAAALYAPVADVESWAQMVLNILNNPSLAPHPSVRSQRAALYSWATHAKVIADAYAALLKNTRT